jgi:hypothetical protein
MSFPLPREFYRSGFVADALEGFTAEHRTKARECARIIAQEDGVRSACDALEKLL